MGRDLEKDLDDEVYEDEYYEEEELIGEDELTDAVERDIDEDDELEEEDLLDDDEEWEKKNNTRKVEMSYACEDCDYRWEEVVIRSKNRLEDDEELDVVCPMCGSTNITQI